MQQPQHVPVLLDECLDLLGVRRGGTYVDATLGLAGHTIAIARSLGGAGQMICFDRDPDAMAEAQRRIAVLAQELGPEMPQIRYVSRPFSALAEEIAPASLDGLLADFGVSSLQLDQPHRGFSFRAEGPLDMRMDPRNELSAHQVVNQADEEDLANLIYEFGEERRSRRIARAIVRARPIHTTAELARVVSAAAPTMKGDKIHPATRTFQALRIRTNDELGEIRSLLERAGSRLKPGGRLACISFHSLEDRLVKDALRDAQRAGTMSVLTRKPMVAGVEESRKNPRSRSAKLRGAEKIG